MRKCWVHWNGECVWILEWTCSVKRRDLHVLREGNQKLLNNEAWLESDQGLSWLSVSFILKNKIENHGRLMNKEQCFLSLVSCIASGYFFLILKLMASYPWVCNENAFPITSIPLVQPSIPKSKTSLSTCFIRTAYTGISVQF